jgi:hypothetical protein
MNTVLQAKRRLVAMIKRVMSQHMRPRVHSTEAIKCRELGVGSHQRPQLLDEYPKVW